ncbi:MAG: site-specific DNA-methyltransferase [Planctomycetes bacterium]|nr:site-specific DNA-methyltransferase [Planctomycetota bacterium]
MARGALEQITGDPKGGPDPDPASELQDYLSTSRRRPLFFCGDAVQVLRRLPAEVFDCCMTSPPYWGKREYSGGGIGLEHTHDAYVESLLQVFQAVHRTLKVSGSFWLNIGDTYLNKCLLGIPWRVALAMLDQQGWVLRNQIVWNKVKGSPDNTDDKLRNVHEPVFHFVKSAKGYYYDIDGIRTAPKKAQVVNGAVVSATGVTGVRYRRQIELSTSLTEHEKSIAYAALEDMLDSVRCGDVADFRMIIRRQQRTTHSDSEQVSGRARELQQRGFYFLKYHPNGSKPGDVWDILPEDTQKRKTHFAPYPADLCRIPLLATCPPDGLALDPFCGTGTTNLVAMQLGRKSVGIDISPEYISSARERCESLL